MQSHQRTPSMNTHKSVATSTDGLVVKREAKVQTDCVVDAHKDFFDEQKTSFLQIMQKHIIIQAYHANGEVLLATFNYIVPYPGTRLLLHGSPS